MKHGLVMHRGIHHRRVMRELMVSEGLLMRQRMVLHWIFMGMLSGFKFVVGHVSRRVVIRIGVVVVMNILMLLVAVRVILIVEGVELVRRHRVHPAHRMVVQVKISGTLQIAALVVTV